MEATGPNYNVVEGGDLPTVEDLRGLGRLDLSWYGGVLPLKDTVQAAFAAELAGVPYWVRVLVDLPARGCWARWCLDNLLAGARIVWFA